MGFFDNQDTSIESKGERKTGCAACGLYKDCLSPKMPISGEGRKGIYILAEAPGKEEDKRNKQLVGPAGRTIRLELKRNGIDMNKDCYRDNAVACRPPENRTPKDKEINYCRPRLMKNLKKVKPKMIIAAGGPSMKALIGDRWIGDKRGVGGISRWRGFHIPDRELNAIISPVYHPSYVNRSKEYDPVVEVIFKRDIKRAIEFYEHFQKREKKEQEIKLHLTDNTTRAMQMLEKHSQGQEVVAIDWECTCLRPNPNGRIVSAAMSFWPSLECIAFLISDDKKFRRELRRVLTNRKIDKIAHNASFEQWWSKYYLGYDINPLKWDTMNISHFLDNRKYITSLKFQTYVNFGIIDYDSHMKQWLHASPSETKKHGANAQNKLRELIKTSDGIRTLLKYNALDASYTLMLFLQQLEYTTNEYWWMP